MHSVGICPNPNALPIPFTWDFKSADEAGIVSENDQTIRIASENNLNQAQQSENE